MLRSMRILSLAIVGLSLLTGALQVLAQSTHEDRVVAVVDEHVITQSQLDTRFNLLKQRLPGELNEAQSKILYRRTLGSLIDEQLQRQYAKQLNIEINDNQIKHAINLYEHSNQMPAGSFDKQLAPSLLHSAKKQIEADLMWTQVINRDIRPRVNISNQEIDRLINNLLGENKIIEREVLQIFMASDDKQAQKRIQDVYQQLKNGADFKALAHTYSEDSYAKQGGYLGWFGSGELAPDLEKKLTNLKVGEFSKPIKSPAGWHILYMAGKRSTPKISTKPFTEKHIYMFQAELPEDAKQRKKRISEIKSFKSNLKTPEQVKQKLDELQQNEAYRNSQDLGWVREEDLSSLYANALQKLDAEEFTPVLQQADSATVLYFAESRQKLPENLEIYRQRIRERLASNRTELFARRLMRNLRRQAFIDIRL